jgi:hypothetical protein
MTYQGQIKNGTIVLDGPIDLPEGVRVQVDITPLDTASKPTLSERLLRYAGKAEGLPPDASRNLDHYLYGVHKT